MLHGKQEQLSCLVALLEVILDVVSDTKSNFWYSLPNQITLLGSGFYFTKTKFQ